MQSKHKGILLFTKIYKENDLFIKFLSDKDHLITGIVYGGLSKKKRNIYQIGNFLDLNIQQFNNRPTTITAEISDPYISNIINDRYKLNCLLSVTSLINLSIIEGQKVNNIFKISTEFLNFMFYNKKWFKEFCIYLFTLLKIIGYEIDFISSNQYKYFDLNDLEFKKNITSETLEFPFNAFKDSNLDLNLDESIKIFKIFETVYVKNHLNNFNLRLPNQYQLFKKLIIDRLKLNG